MYSWWLKNFQHVVFVGSPFFRAEDFTSFQWTMLFVLDPVANLVSLGHHVTSRKMVVAG